MQYSKAFLHYFFETDHAGLLVGEDVVILDHHTKNPFDEFRFYIATDGTCIKCIRWKAGTTPALIATGEYVAQYVEGKTIKEAISLQKEQILQELGLDARFNHVVNIVLRLLQRLEPSVK